MGMMVGSRIGLIFVLMDSDALVTLFIKLYLLSLS